MPKIALFSQNQKIFSISVDFEAIKTSCLCWTHLQITNTSKKTSMQYLLPIYGDEKAWFDLPQAELQKGYQAYMDFTKDIMALGCMLAGSELKPITTGSTVRVKNGKTFTTDGSFAETKEQLGGYYLIDVPALDDALAWAAKCTGSWGGSIEVRPLNDTPMPE